MQTLRKTQAAVAASILSGAETDGLIVTGGLTSAQRLQVYRNHYRITLNEALALTFPVTARLVGEGFFKTLTDAFTAAHPPTQPVVGEYGADLPAFIAAFAPAASLPYLSDVAMMEWLLNEAVQAAEYEGKMFYTRYPVAKIWETNQKDYTGDATIRLDAGGGWIVVKKTSGEAKWQWLNLPEDAFS